MSQNLRVVNGFNPRSASQLVRAGGVVLAGLTDNPAFPSPPLDLKMLQTAVDDLNAALAARAQAREAARAEKDSKRAALIAQLRRLSHYVEDNCGNDLAVFLSSGFRAAGDTRYRAPLATPSIVRLDPGNRGEFVLKVTRIPRARCYEVRMAAEGADNVLGSWQTAGLFTRSRMRIPGLTSGVTYAFQVRAVGGSTGYSDWSNSVLRMCV
jgi:hypothetical protein